jgi:electron transfer flavoprotein beta subunit
MKTLVCLKQILDPEISPRDFQVDSDRLEAASGSASLVTNIFCENALETALQLREENDGEITALTFGSDSAEEVLRKALALRVDHAYRIADPGIQHCTSAAAATVLAAAIKKLGTFDIIMLGREAGDWGEGQTTGLVAELLGLPCVSFVDKIDIVEVNVKLHRQTDFGREQLLAALPVVVSITNTESNVPRIPKTRDIMLAHRKQLTTWTLDDIGLDADKLAQASNSTQVVELYVPEETNNCEFMTGDTIDDRIREFAQRIVNIVQSV